MKIALVDLHTSNWSEMADITLTEKKKYADKHGYSLFVQVDGIIPDVYFGYQKLFQIEKLMEENPDIEWFWYAGTDCLITNHNIKLEDMIDDDSHFIVTQDSGGPIADIFFIRSSPEGKEYLQHLKNSPFRFGIPHLDSEQAQMWMDKDDPKWQTITKYLPQNAMNAFALNQPGLTHLPRTDISGNRSWWEPGDFLLHAISGYTPDYTPKQLFDWKCNILRQHISSITY